MDFEPDAGVKEGFHWWRRAGVSGGDSGFRTESSTNSRGGNMAAQVHNMWTQFTHTHTNTHAHTQTPGLAGHLYHSELWWLLGFHQIPAIFTGPVLLDVIVPAVLPDWVGPPSPLFSPSSTFYLWSWLPSVLPLDCSRLPGKGLGSPWLHFWSFHPCLLCGNRSS